MCPRERCSPGQSGKVGHNKLQQQRLRDSHSSQKKSSKADAINAITPLQSIAAVMQERGERYRERIAGVSERVVSHVDSLEPGTILDQIDTIARRTFGLNDAASGQGALTLSVLTNHAVVQVKAQVPAAPSSDK
ncbi:MAG: hypothetical protein DME45_04315 [Verrucomicrobia bacterium]|nr:MAG: hypothetical protein DME45_04315 [Verrucomicrobiota bacterium]